MKNLTPLIFCCLLSICAFATPQIIHVDSSATCSTCDGQSWSTAYQALYTAMNASSSGDTILVAEGTYYPTSGIDRNATLNLVSGVAIIGGYASGGSSSSDPVNNPTIVSGDIGIGGTTTDNSFRIFHGVSLDSATVLKGLTIRDGYMDSGFTGDGYGGSALFLRLSWLRVEECNFIKNYSYKQGGAVWVGTNSSIYEMRFTDCDFRDNESASLGGAFYLNLGKITFRDCDFTGNEANSNGGAISARYSGVGSGNRTDMYNCNFINNSSNIGYGGGAAIGKTITSGCTFTSNTAKNGGGLFVGANMEADVYDCLLDSNSVTVDGGGIYTGGGSAEQRVDRCVFYDNSAIKKAGAALIAGGGNNTFYTNCLFLENTANQYGGVISCYASKPNIINSTFIGNAAPKGSVAFSWYGGNPKFSNCIFDTNYVDHPYEEIYLYPGSGASAGFVTVTYTLADSLYAGVGNSTDQPWFSATSGDPKGLDGEWFTPDDRYHIVNDVLNPALDAGRNDSIPSHVNYDILSNNRIFNGTVDIGAYEYRTVACPNTTNLYVDSSKVNGDGETWATALTNLYDALALADTCPGGIDTIFIAEGTYYTNDDDDRTSVMNLVSGVVILGSYPSGGGVPDTASHGSIISGDIGVQGDDSDNSYRLFYGEHLSSSTLIRGLIMRDANMDNTFTADTLGGAAIRFEYSEGRVEQCRFIDNFSKNPGGGVYIGASLLGKKIFFEDCYFEGNVSEDKGGGVRCRLGNTSFSNCTFTNNEGTSGGGAQIYHTTSQPNTSDFYNCTFIGNRATDGTAGGASTAIGEVLDCTFIDNYAEVSAGALYMYPHAQTLVRGCIFESNKCLDRGGAIVSGGGTEDHHIDRSVFYENTADKYGGGLAMTGGGSLQVVSNCLFVRDSSSIHGGAVYVVGATCEPSLVSCTFVENWANNTGSASFSWYNAHPTFSNCIFESNYVNSPFEAVGIYPSGNTNVIGFVTIEYSAIDSVFAGATGNITSQPLYLSTSGNERGSDDTWFTDDDRYNLSTSGSNPVAGAGLNSAVPSHALVDIVGNPRINGGAVDMGAYEQPPTIICGLFSDYIRVAQGTLTEDGSEWTTAYHNLTTALLAAESCDIDTIKMAAGTYVPTLSASRLASYELIDDVLIIGGHSATGLWDTTSYVTVLSGDIGASGNASDNSHHVVVANNVENTALIAVRITGGNANYSNTSEGGGAVYMTDAELTMDHCTLDFNTSEFGGGAIHGSGAVDLSLTNCTLSDNDATNSSDGGAIHISSSSVDFSEVNLQQTTIEDCDARNGGAISITGAVDLRVYDLTANDNTATANGGALSLNGVKAFDFSESNFERNSANEGGAIWMDDTWINLDNSVFSENTATTIAGAIYADGRRVSLSRNEFLENTAAEAGAVYLGNEVQASIASSVFFRNEALTAGGGAIVNESGDLVEVLNSAFIANEAEGDGGAISINQEDIHRNTGPVNIPTNLINLSMVRNHSNGQGGAVFGTADAEEYRLDVFNSILWGNTDDDGVLTEVDEGGDIGTRVRWSIIESVLSGWDPNGTNLLNTNPEFVAGSVASLIDINGLIGADNTWMTTDDSLHLTATSPAIDKGDRPWIPQAIDLDLGQDLRIMGSRPEMGAYEYSDDPYTARQLPSEGEDLLTFMGCEDLPITDSIDVTDALFGADGSDALDDTYAFLRVSQYIREHWSTTGRLLVKIPDGTYIVGEQFDWSSTPYVIASNDTSIYSDVTIDNSGSGKDKIFYSEPVFNLNSVKNVIFRGGEDAKLVAPEGLYFGQLSSADITTFNAAFGISPTDPDQSFVSATIMFQLIECECIQVNSLELDGNAEHADVDVSINGNSIQAGYDGVLNIGSDRTVLNDLSIHQFGRDGVMVHVTDGYAGATIPQDNLLNHVESYLNGRSGMSWTGGRNLIVLNSDFSKTGLTALGTISNVDGNGAGLDIEPELGDCIEGYFYRTNFHDCAGAPLIMTNPGSGFYAKTWNMTFDECEIWGRNSFSMSVLKSRNLVFKNSVIRGRIRTLSGGAANDFVKFDSCLITDVGVLGNNAFHTILPDSVGGEIEPWNATNNFFAFENCVIDLHYGRFCTDMLLDLDHWYTRRLSCNQFQINSSTYADPNLGTAGCNAGFGHPMGAITQAELESNSFIDITPINPNTFSLQSGSCDMIYLNFSNDPAINHSDGNNTFTPKKSTQYLRLTRRTEFNGSNFSVSDF